MATKITSKKPLSGNKRSHSLRATKRMQKVNLQALTLADGTKIRTSAREMRTLRKLSNSQATEQAEQAA